MIAETESTALTSALLKWCDAIAGTYGVPVHNLTSSLADGRALCLLIHYYHPTILATNMIQNTTASLLVPFECPDNDYSLEKFTEATALNGGVLSKADVKRGLDGERKNFAILRRCVMKIFMSATLAHFPHIFYTFVHRIKFIRLKTFSDFYTINTF